MTNSSDLTLGQSHAIKSRLPQTLEGDRGEEFYQNFLTVIQDHSLKFRFSDPAELHIERTHAKPLQSLAVLPPSVNIRTFLQPEFIGSADVELKEEPPKKVVLPAPKEGGHNEAPAKHLSVTVESGRRQKRNLSNSDNEDDTEHH